VLYEVIVLVYTIGVEVHIEPVTVLQPIEAPLIAPVVVEIVQEHKQI